MKIINNVIKFIEIINCGDISIIPLGFWHIEIECGYLAFASNISKNTIASFWCWATDDGVLSETIV